MTDNTNGRDARLERVIAGMQLSGCGHMRALAKRLERIMADERAARRDAALAHMRLYDGLIEAAFIDYELALVRGRRHDLQKEEAK